MCGQVCAAPRKPAWRLGNRVGLIVALGALACGCAPGPHAVLQSRAANAWMRVSQIGYRPDDPKIAVLSSESPIRGTFRVGEYVAEIGPDQGAWGPFAHNYRLDFSAQTQPGTYHVACGDCRSPEFVIGDHAFDGARRRLIQFMRLQRCGDNPVTGHKCHQLDASDTDTGAKLDLTGGWHDAGDRLKHMITTSYCVAALLLAGERDEGLHGASLLKRLHPDPDSIYVQIGDDRDHLPPHVMWHLDQSDYGWGRGGARSAWRATGMPQGPKYQNKSDGVANLAGRCAAALALAGDIATARSLYSLAKSKPGCAQSVPVRAPHYYMESNYSDDLEWAAAELYIATREPEFLRDAIEAADKAAASEWMGNERHGHYEWFPYVNLAHWRLYPHVDGQTQARLAGYYRIGLERIRARALKNPYRLGTPLVWCSTNDAIACATQAALYEQMTGDPQFRSLGAESRDWIFGRNPWGVSFVLGVPSGGDAATRAHHPYFWEHGAAPIGGVVDGPVYKDINDALKFTPWKQDRLARFQSEIGVYHDESEDFSTNEPIIDGTVALRFLLEVWR